MHQSVATIDSPEFLNLQPLDINPLMSKCEIKVLYVGANRNHTFITEEVAAEIGKTLRGAPIVGYYRDTKEDFTDHGEKIIIDDEGIKFECQTVPYGFVAPDAKVWFQNFEDNDGMGNTVVHKYLMTTGYLWTDQFPESSLPVEEGRPQSMEFQKESVQGHWETNYDNGMDFFIINDAIIQKICILGDDVEPCFEGASVTAPDVSTKFTLDDNFRHTLYSMMQDLKNALNGGGQQVENLENTAAVEQEQVEPATEFTQDAENVAETVSEVNDNVKDASAPADYVNKKDEDEKSSEEETEKSDSESSSDADEDDEDENKKGAKKYELLEEELNTLKENYSTLQNQYQELVNFKREIDNQKKDALIAEFYMLSDEDKADVISNKEKYTLDEIKAKLAVICFDKKINFTLNEEVDNNKEEEIVTYSLNDNNENNSLPEWVKAVKEQEKLG
jgi:hypothetical protein